MDVRYSWNNIENPSNAIIDVLYTYDGSWSDPINPPQILESWKGYSVRNLEAHNVLIKLKPVPVNVTSKIIAENDDVLWYLSIKASAGEAVDHANRLGIRYESEEEWDRHDHVEPPLIGEYVSIAFPHSDWAEYPYDYTVDFRPPHSEKSWDFDVKSNISKETVTVQLLNTEHLPFGAAVTIFDRETGEKLPVTSNVFTFLTDTEITERHFTLVVSDVQKPETDETLPIPEQFVTARCYPNPFNPQTTIHYELSHPGKVIISVYNAVGQLVKTFEEGFRDQGIYEVVFNASDLTSGLYVFRVDAGYSSVTSKMLYMK